MEFVDLYSQYLDLKGELDKIIADVIKNSTYVRGKYVDIFEKNFATLIGVEHCVSCANGTDSLYIAMRMLDIQPGDEVICPAHSWISTSESVTQAGGRVVFCDTDLDTFNIDVSQIERIITDRTVGIIPVHLYGQAAEMAPILFLAKKYKLWVLEDCAQAHLAEYRGRKVGTIGDVGSFSFYPGKNLGAMGDAGALVTNNAKLAERMAMFARHGGLSKGQHLIEGINSRMDGLQAAILNIKCNYIEAWTAKRQKISSYYLENIENDLVQLPRVAEFSTHVWHLFVIRCEQRDKLREYLEALSIPTVINYPIALPFLPAYRYLNKSASDFPNAHYNQSRILSIPIYPELSQEQLDYIVNCINEFN